MFNVLELMKKSIFGGKIYKKWWFLVSMFLVALMIMFRMFCGIFVLEPIGAVPKGVTIVYWKSSLPKYLKYAKSDNIEFVSSLESIIKNAGLINSPINRIYILNDVIPEFMEHKIVKFEYSEFLYNYTN